MNIVEVTNVSKRFQIGSGSIKHALLDRKAASAGRDFWALRDVSFSLEQGGSLGIVGHNGSGKSTMLKLLTRILQPTSGTVRTEGRIGALIEVGAGFHPDLTGRENVFLNGSILGLTRAEIVRKFDAIVDFAGLEQFIDTPVKRYSSGMYMRLGFAIAAHIDPDILVIDEVLAVGDQQFQNKCMRRMKEFQAQGGTVIFVSHSMSSVSDLCHQCVWLDHGKLMFHGPAEEAIGRYLTLVAEREKEEIKKYQSKGETQPSELPGEDGKPDPDLARVVGVTLFDGAGRPKTHFEAGKPLRAQIRYRFAHALPDPGFIVKIFRNDGLLMFETNNHDLGVRLAGLPPEGQVTFDVPFLGLNEGAYYLRAIVCPDTTVDNWRAKASHVIKRAVDFTVAVDHPTQGCGYMPVQWQADPLGATPVLNGAGAR
uniref:Teichoic acid export ATP-binding protein TagH n=1 Tax=uncultured Armatimonadetes bacterium TaxID=157466 RepID=A0A6J4ILQ5_9BACT|nr:Teichoic acid export ATP-binding protein TagH [uncultured Armatimonadetes bacterium]